MSRSEENRRAIGVAVVIVITFCVLAGRLIYISRQSVEEPDYDSAPTYDYDYTDGIDDADTINDEFLSDVPAEAEAKANDIGFTFKGGYGVKTKAE
jgi:hypothetical protein